MTEPAVRVEGSGATRTVRLDRPERNNAQTSQLWAGLAAAGRNLAPAAVGQAACIRAAAATLPS